MTRDTRTDGHDAVGLCADCRHSTIVQNDRGSSFYFCERSRTDARFRKYPPLPVVRCLGYEPRLSTPRRGQ